MALPALTASTLSYSETKDQEAWGEMEPALPKDPRPTGFLILYPTPALTSGPGLGGLPGVPRVAVPREFPPTKAILRSIAMVNFVYQLAWAKGYLDVG